MDKFGIFKKTNLNLFSKYTVLDINFNLSSIIEFDRIKNELMLITNKKPKILNIEEFIFENGKCIFKNNKYYDNNEKVVLNEYNNDYLFE